MSKRQQTMDGNPDLTPAEAAETRAIPESTLNAWRAQKSSSRMYM